MAQNNQNNTSVEFHPMIPEELERLISRYDEADMTAEERAQLQSVLAESPEAREVLRQYQQLDKAMSRLPAAGELDGAVSEQLESVDYDALHARINRAIDGIAASDSGDNAVAVAGPDAEEAGETKAHVTVAADRRTAAGGVAGGLSTTEDETAGSSQRMLFYRRLRRFSLAASIAVAALIGVAVWRSGEPGVNVPGEYGPTIAHNGGSTGSGLVDDNNVAAGRKAIPAVQLAPIPTRHRHRTGAQVVLASITRAAGGNREGAIPRVTLALTTEPSERGYSNQEESSLVVCSASPKDNANRYEDEALKPQLDSSYYMLF